MRFLPILVQAAKAGLLFISLISSNGSSAEISSIDLAASTMAPCRVRAQFTVGGDLTLEAPGGGAKVPMSVVANFSYREQPLASDRTPATGDVRSIRYYDEARATIKIDKGGLQLKLPEQSRLIVATTGPSTAILASPEGPLTREHLDLIDIPAGTHVLDRLLPGSTHAIGDPWKHDKESMRLLLGLDDVSVCEVESVLTGEEQGFAKMRLSGTIYGKTDDAATEMEVKGGYLFDIRLRRITRMNLAFTEKRKAGRIGPALDVVGKLTLEIDSLSDADRIPQDLLAKADAIAELETRLFVDDKTAGVSLLHDRQWYVTSEGTDRLVLRRLDDGEFVAQCNIHLRPERHEGRQATLAEFERDIRFSLGQRFESLVSTGEWSNLAGLLCYRMVVHGNVDGLPVEWRYYLASPPEGRSVAVAVSVEPRLTEQLGDADKAIVDSIELLPVADSKPAASGESAQAATETANK